jgi:GTP-binding protein
MKVAIVGRPNVGKSMLLNALLGKERAIVSEVPGTTRDALDTLLNYDDKSVLLIDTAGIRRRGQVAIGIEKYSVLRAFRAIDRADVTLLILDAAEMVAAQDTHIAGYICQEALKGIVVVVNKWDLVENSQENKKIYINEIKKKFKFLPQSPILFISAEQGWRVKETLTRAREIFEERQKRVPKSQLEDVVAQAVAAHTPPSVGRRNFKMLKVVQTDVNPPTFTFLVNSERTPHFSYQRYLENTLRRHFGFRGTPIRLTFKIRVRQG